MIEITLNQKLPGYRGTVGDATIAAHEGCKRATRALNAQGISLIPGVGLMLQMDINPTIGDPWEWFEALHPAERDRIIQKAQLAKQAALALRTSYNSMGDLTHARRAAAIFRG